MKVSSTQFASKPSQRSGAFGRHTRRTGPPHGTAGTPRTGSGRNATGAASRPQEKPV